ncbi:phosphate butyryltransferase [Metabacillus niabensis]|uniref:Phosphate butyryltransferase n=1 Tax=Metabacillus niabensis TaxID=324854 RepID=A0ABT9Z114_9BACI|nr:phosphate butyryltransferase [Metabacillus niabensis]MDQ0224975.1 phosphate butyryltransferase [Metabacillus niabensis]
MNFEKLLNHITEINGRVVAVAAADDEEVIEAVKEAVLRKLAMFILFGNKEKIDKLLRLKGIKNDNIQVIHTQTKEEAAELAVKSVHNDEATILMKGMVSSATLLKAVLNKEYGLRTNRVLSHVAIFEIPGFSKSMIVTDAAMNIHPNLEKKQQIIENAVDMAKSIGVNNPKVAVLAAIENVNPAMEVTLDAASLTLMNKRGQIKDCIIDGPLALDNAVSTIAAKQKGIDSEVAGNADILLVPTIEAGNILYKSLIYFAKAKVGSVIAGAKAPIVLTSRSDSAECKLYSLALAICSSK